MENNAPPHHILCAIRRPRDESLRGEGEPRDIQRRIYEFINNMRYGITRGGRVISYKTRLSELHGIRATSKSEIISRGRVTSFYVSAIRCRRSRLLNE